MSLRCTDPHDETDPLVSLQELRDHLRLDATPDEDADLTIKLNASIQRLEGETGRAFLESTWEWRIADWPAGDTLVLPKLQVQSAGPITYMDANGDTHTFDSANYRLIGLHDKTTNPKETTYVAKIVLRYGRVWPTGALENGEPITIPLVCGWQDGASAPEQLKAAVLLEAAHRYRYREAVTTGNADKQSAPLALGVEYLISRFVDQAF